MFFPVTGTTSSGGSALGSGRAVAGSEDGAGFFGEDSGVRAPQLLARDSTRNSQTFRSRRRHNPTGSALRTQRRKVLRRSQQGVLCGDGRMGSFGGVNPAYSKPHASTLTRLPHFSETEKVAAGEPKVSPRSQVQPSPRTGYVSKELTHILRQWDNGNMSVRRSIISHFIFEHRAETASVIEASYANGGSLLLSRILSSARITSLSVADQVSHFRGIQVFIASSSGASYLSEFLEAGGLDVVLGSLRSVIEDTGYIGSAASGLNVTNGDAECPIPRMFGSPLTELCRAALEILRLVACVGRPQKELLCECGVLQEVSTVMKCAFNSVIGHDGRSLLLELGSGNPRFEDEVLYTVLQMLYSINPVCQRMAAQTSRALMSSLSFHASQGAHNAAMSFVPAAVNMTQSVDLQVQYESAELLTVLAQDCPATLPMVVSSLLPLIKNPVIAPYNHVQDMGGVQSTREGDASMGIENGEGGNAGEGLELELLEERTTAKDREATLSILDLRAAAHSWQASSMRALEVILQLEEAPRILTEQFGIYALLGALLNMSNVDVRDASLDALRLLAVSHEIIGSMSVGQVSSAAIHSVLGDQWHILKSLDTTVGLVIEDVDGRKETILKESGWQTETFFSKEDREKLINNMRTCKRAAHRGGKRNIAAADPDLPNSVGARKHTTKPMKKGTKKKKMQVKQVDPETSDCANDSDYRPLMERLIRSSLPELMDRDFGGLARVAIQTRKKAKDRRSGFLTRRA